MSLWHCSHVSPRSQMSFDYEEDENEAFLPPRRVFSFDEWNERPITKTETPQVFSFDEWTDPGDEDDEDQYHHSYTKPPTRASIFRQVTQPVSIVYNTSATRRGILIDLLVPLEITQSECGGDITAKSASIVLTPNFRISTVLYD